MPQAIAKPTTWSAFKLTLKRDLLIAFKRKNDIVNPFISGLDKCPCVSGVCLGCDRHVTHGVSVWQQCAYFGLCFDAGRLFERSVWRLGLFSLPL